MSFASERHLPISVLTELPREWPVELLPAIRREVVRTRRKLVILDDDPTGTQTVHGLPVLTHWSEPALVEELRGEHQAFFLLTNSRSLPELQARAPRCRDRGKLTTGHGTFRERSDSRQSQ